MSLACLGPGLPRPRAIQALPTRWLECHCCLLSERRFAPAPPRLSDTTWFPTRDVHLDAADPSLPPHSLCEGLYDTTRHNTTRHNLQRQRQPRPSPSRPQEPKMSRPCRRRRRGGGNLEAPGSVAPRPSTAHHPVTVPRTHARTHTRCRPSVRLSLGAVLVADRPRPLVVFVSAPVLRVPSKSPPSRLTRPGPACLSAPCLFVGR